MYCKAIYRLCKFIPNCMAIDQSNADFTFCTVGVQKVKFASDWSIVVPQAAG